MVLKLYNTFSRKKETFKPRKDKKINLFVCGPTVYDFSHIGHARTYIFFDMMAKYLKEKGYDVFYLQNITDIDDKIIKRAREEKRDWKKISRQFEKEYLKDVKSLGITSVKKYARATDHIKEIISQVKRLLKNGYAYQIEDGIYYDISKFKEYGKLSKRTVLQAQDAVSRIDEAIKKKNKGDFCLWKISKSDEPSWQSPWGKGRPGWHIEDTAIAEKYFGPQYDIHGGAIELSFPHHEAEIAQMETISGKKPMVRYWLHTGLLTVKGVKMAKSLKNFITIKDFLKEYSARILRFFILKTHYRSSIDYSKDIISQAKKELEKIDEFVNKLSRYKKLKRSLKNVKNLNLKERNLILKIKKEFEKAMEDDFNTPRVIAAIFNLVNKGNSLLARDKLTPTVARDILKLLKKIDRFFNFIFLNKKGFQKIPFFIKKMIKEREKARKKQDWKLADEIRKKINLMGYRLEDTKKGPEIKKL